MLGFSDLENNADVDFSPSNLWAEDRTKVAGPVALIEALLNDTELEAVRPP